MRFLKTLRKAQLEKPLRADRNGSVQESTNSSDVFRTPEFKFGVPMQVADSSGNGRDDETLVSSTLKSLPVVAAERVTQPKEYEKITIENYRINPRLVAFTQPSSALCESYRSLRTHVLNAASRDSIKSIVMLSAESGEGKSLTSLNLCWLLAQTEGVRTLLIDADLRKPSIAAYLGIEPESGLGGVLDGKLSLQDAIVELRPSGLHLLPVDRPRPDLTENIAGTSFQTMLREASLLFDIVIIDAPPLRLFNDATVIANAADGAIMVIKSNQISYKDAQKVLDLIPQDRLIGAVVNQSDSPMVGAGYGYGYGYYKSY